MTRYVGLDPSTQTGIVILDKRGNVVFEKEITTKEKNDPERFIDIRDQVFKRIKKNDKVFIEGFSYGSRGRGVSTQYGVGWVIRTMFVESSIDYIEVTPGQLKKFATGKGNTSKDNMILPIYKRWQYEHNSDNVRDAYVLAQIGRAADKFYDTTKFQDEVLKTLFK